MLIQKLTKTCPDETQPVLDVAVTKQMHGYHSPHGDMTYFTNSEHSLHTLLTKTRPHSIKPNRPQSNTERNQ